MNYRLFALLIALAACAQTQPPKEFEVASVKLNVGGSNGTSINAPLDGRLTVTNAPLAMLIRNALGILPFQLDGGPSWINGDRWDVTAKVTTTEKLTREQARILLLALLVDRFQLKFHRETREESIYSLVQARGGVKMPKSATAAGTGSLNISMSSDKGNMKGTGVVAADLARNLANQVGRLVHDDTGLSEPYDLTLEWSPNQSADAPGPSIFTAIQEQLGLRLDSKKGPVEVIVIDSVARASEN